MADAAKKDETVNEELPKRSLLNGKTVIVGFVSMVVVLETALFFFLVPSAEEVSALAEARLIQSVQSGQANQKSDISAENEAKEFLFGMFGETFSPLDSDDRYRVELRLFGLVRKKDYDRLAAEFDNKEGRIRHNIRMKIRMSDLTELDENQLGLLQRRILTTVNHLLEEDLLLSVGFHEYQLSKE